MNLKPWNGKDASGSYQLPEDQMTGWNMQIDDDGTIYYMSHETIPKLLIWCPAKRLSKHLHHLEQIAARK
jgi:hypothetical protein